MDEAFTDTWNSQVKSEDTVFVLGDFARYQTHDYRETLNGKINMIWGNHDMRSIKHPFNSAYEVYMLKVGEQLVWLSHYAHRVWPQSHYGAWHLYAHCHGTLPDLPDSYSMDVGIDAHTALVDGKIIQDYKLYSYDEIAAAMARKTVNLTGRNRIRQPTARANPGATLD
jgi:calcineurin-like phosphoesterase family protein